MKKIFNIMLAVIILCISFVCSVNAETESGRIVGTTDIGELSLILTGSNYSAKTVSDENGDFVFENVPAGDYEIYASKYGYLSMSINVTVTAGETVIARPYVLAGDDTVDNCARISGNINVSGATITLYGWVTKLKTVTSDENGNFSLGTVSPQNDLHINVKKDGYVDMSWNVNVTKQETTNINIFMPESATEIQSDPFYYVSLAYEDTSGEDTLKILAEPSDTANEKSGSSLFCAFYNVNGRLLDLQCMTLDDADSYSRYYIELPVSLQKEDISAIKVFVRSSQSDMKPLAQSAWVSCQ